MERKSALRKHATARQLEQELADAFVDGEPLSGPASILLVAACDSTRMDLTALFNGSRHRCQCAATLQDARAALTRARFDLLLLNPALPDGDGIELMQLVQRLNPASKTIVISNSSAQETAVAALRQGAVDFFSLPMDLNELSSRCDAALLKSRADQQREERLAHLKTICKKLNIARREVSDQVDSLCKDLVSAYQEIAGQLGDVAMASEFRTMLRLELDVEDLLRTALEYLLTKTGPTNAAVFLPDTAGHFTLGAYVNYDCPRESISVLLDHLCSAICPQMMDEPRIMRFKSGTEFAQWIGFGPTLLSESQVMAFGCMDEEECLAVIVLFRAQSEPFAADLPATLDVLRPIFAEQISNVIRIHHRASPEWPGDAGDDDEYDFNDDPRNDDYGFGGGIAA